MLPHYQHAQYGWWLVLVSLFLFGQAAFLYIASGWFWAAFSVSLGLLIILLFFQLRVAVDNSHLYLAFGIDLVRRSIALTDIVGAEAVRNALVWLGPGAPRTAG